MSNKRKSDVFYNDMTFNVEESASDYDIKTNFINDIGFRQTWEETYPKEFFSVEEAMADLRRYVREWGMRFLSDYGDERGYDLYFHNDTSVNSKGFKESYAYCRDYIRQGNGTNESYFEDYKGGVVQIVRNDTDEVVYVEVVR